MVGICPPAARRSASAVLTSTSTRAVRWAISSSRESVERWRSVRCAPVHATSSTGRQIPLVTNRGPQSHP